MDSDPLSPEEWEEIYGSIAYGRHGNPDLATYSDDPEPHVLVWFGPYYVRCPASDHPQARQEKPMIREKARKNVVEALDETKYAQETN